MVSTSLSSIHWALFVCFFAFQLRCVPSAYLFCTTGPPTVPKLSAFRLDMGPSANFSCKANQLNAQQMASYKWKWMFKHEREITDVYGKYKVLSMFSSPNSCQQTMGAVYLRVENLTTEDLGTYKCVLFENEVEIAAEDVPFYEYGMLCALNCTYLVSFNGKYNTLIIRVTYSLTLIYPRLPGAPINTVTPLRTSTTYTTIKPCRLVTVPYFCMRPSRSKTLHYGRPS